MPSVYAGTSTQPLAVPWNPTTAATAGTTIVQPTVATGQYFMATVSGTTSSTQPAWSTLSALPVPGTTFVDGTVTWTCMGAIIAASGTVALDIPVDTDPKSTVVMGRAFKNIANYIASLRGLYGFLSGNNTWTGNNTWQGGAIIQDALTLQNQTDQTKLIALGTVIPTLRQLIATTPITMSGIHTIQGRLYGDGNLTIDADTTGWSFTINAAWNGTSWVKDGSTLEATRFSIGQDGIYLQYVIGGTSSPFTDSTWTEPFALTGNGNLAIAGGLSSGGPVTSLASVTTSGNYGVPNVVASSGSTAAASFSLVTPSSGPAYASAGVVRVSVRATCTTGAAPYLTVQGDETLGVVPMIVVGASTLTHYSFVGVFFKTNNSQLIVTGNAGGGTTWMAGILELLD